MLTDADLVQAARAGSPVGFDRLVERHQSMLRAFLRRTLGGSRDEADDLAQDVFLVAWRSLGGLKEPAGFRAWLCGIGWRKAQDQLRRRHRGAARDYQWLEASEAPAGISPEDRLSMASAMTSLPADVRACVSLCLADGLSHAEASVALGLPLGTVKSHVLRGRKRLLAALGGPDDA